MTRVLLVTLMVSTLASSRVASQPQAPAASTSAVSTCLAAAREHATAALNEGAERTAARQQLEIEAASCFDPTLTPAAARAIGIVSSDRARFARDFIEGKMTLAAYRAALDDRRRKLTRLLDNPPAQQALQQGDADGDLVPDLADRCPNTPHGTPTDDRGCPRRVTSDPSDTRDEGRLRETLAGARFLYNPSCEDAPRPQIPVPLEWGRGQQTKHKTAGFNLAIAKVSGQPAGCEIFYEIQLRFIDPNPGNPALPPSKIVTMVFSGGEDLLTDPRRAVFGLPMNVTISPARGEAREAFAREYFRATWRVRAVNGSNRTSPWSHFVTQGPASSGVDG
jgi:hypothetical protein